MSTESLRQRWELLAAEFDRLPEIATNSTIKDGTLWPGVARAVFGGESGQRFDELSELAGRLLLETPGAECVDGDDDRCRWLRYLIDAGTGVDVKTIEGTTNAGATVGYLIARIDHAERRSREAIASILIAIEVPNIRDRQSVLDPALSVALESLVRLLRNLVFWAECPQSEPLTQNWADSSIDEIRGVADLAIRITDDSRLTERLRDARNLANRFVIAMTNNPAMSTVRYSRWESAVDRQIVIGLVALQGEFAALAKSMETEDPSDEPEYPIQREPKQDTPIEPDYLLSRADIAIVLGCDPSKVARLANGNQWLTYSGTGKGQSPYLYAWSSIRPLLHALGTPRPEVIDDKFRRNKAKFRRTDSP